jgi:hypothetical protein
MQQERIISQRSIFSKDRNAEAFQEEAWQPISIEF